MPGTYPSYTLNTMDTQYDIPGRKDISNAADFNSHDLEIYTHQGILVAHAASILTLEGRVDQSLLISSSPTFAGATFTSTLPVVPTGYPTSNNQVANKAYVDSVIASSNELSEILANGNSAGAYTINMNNNKITSLATPTANADAATKLYVDSAVLTVNEFIELTDTPSSYSGMASSGVRVNAGANALEFYDTGSTDIDTLDIILGRGDTSASHNITLSAGNVTASQLVSTVASGTSPITVTSPTSITNLNADKVDGYDFDQPLTTSSTPSFSTITISHASGVSPFVVTSPTKVVNFNSDMLDGYHASDFALSTGAGYVPYTGATSNVDLGSYSLTTTGTVTAEQLTSTHDIACKESLSIIDSSGGITFTTRLGYEIDSSTPSPTHRMNLSFTNESYRDTTMMFVFGAAKDAGIELLQMSDVSVNYDAIRSRTGYLELHANGGGWSSILLGGGKVRIELADFTCDSDISAGDNLYVTASGVLNNISTKSITASGNIVANKFYGDGSALTGLPSDSDTLQIVTDRGNSTTNSVIFGASGIFQNISTKSITASGNAVITGNLTAYTYCPDSTTGMCLPTLQSFWPFKYRDGLGVNNTGIKFSLETTSFEFNYLGNEMFSVDISGNSVTLNDASATSFSIAGSTLDSSEFGYLDGLNQSVSTNATPIFTGIGCYGDMSADSSGVYNIGGVAYAFNDAHIDQVYLKGDPTDPFQAATKHYVDSSVPTLTFLNLSDTPNSYSGMASSGVRVNSGANALEFYDPGFTDIDTLDIVLGRGDTSSDHNITLTGGTLKAEQVTSTHNISASGQIFLNNALGSNNYTATLGYETLDPGGPMQRNRMLLSYLSDGVGDSEMHLKYGVYGLGGILLYNIWDFQMFDTIAPYGGYLELDANGGGSNSTIMMGNGQFRIYSGNLVCDSSCSGVLQNISTKSVTASGNVLADNFVVSSGGDIKPTSDSTSALNIAQSNGTEFVTFDTTNKRTSFRKGTAGTSPGWVAADVAVFENDSASNAALQVFTANSKLGILAFSDPETRNIGGVSYDHSLDTLYLNANSVSGLKIVGSNRYIAISNSTTSLTPTVALHQDYGNATATYHKFTAGTTTGVTATDGFDVGITSTGSAELRQYENLPITMFTNNTNAFQILPGGSLISPNTASGVFYDISTNSITASGNLTVDSSLLFVDSSSNRVGIGNSSPSTQLVIGSPSSDFSTFFTASATENEGVIIEFNGTSGARGLGILNTTTAGSSLGGSYITLCQNDGTIMQSGERLGGITYGGGTAQSGANSIKAATAITSFATENWVYNTSFGSDLRLQITQNGTTTRLTKIWLDGATGFCTIGGASTAAAMLDVYSASSTQALRIRGTTSTSQYCDFYIDSSSNLNIDSTGITHLKDSVVIDGSIAVDASGAFENISTESITASGNVLANNFVIVAGGDIKPSSNSTSAINIAQANGTEFVTFDTTNKRVGINTTSPGDTFTILGGDMGLGSTAEKVDRTLTIYGNNSGSTTNQWIKTEGTTGRWHSGYGSFQVEPAGDLIVKPWNAVDNSYVSQAVFYRSGGFVVGRNYVSTVPPSQGMIVQGNVGVGNNSPTKTLHVTGEIYGTTNGYLDASGIFKNISTESITASGNFVATGSVYNTRIVPRVLTITSSATPSINTDLYDAVTITALATNITSMTTSLSGNPNNFDKLMIRVKDDGSARSIAWGTSYEAKGIPLPVTTVASKVLTVGLIYDSVTSKWGCVSAAQEF